MSPHDRLSDRERTQAEQRAYDDLAAQALAHLDEASLLLPEDIRSVPLGSLTVFALGLLGDVAGKRVLDLGGGEGIVAVALARGGGEVHLVDISEKQLGLARLRARVNGVARRIHLGRMACEALALRDESFDCVFGDYILHHVDVAAAAREVARVLRPGGRAVFAETWGRNPLLRFARRFLAGRMGVARYGTPWERPLRPADVARLRPVFRSVRTYHPEFCFFRLANTRVFKSPDRFPTVQRLLKGLDAAVTCCLPFLRSFGYKVALELVK